MTRYFLISFFAFVGISKVYVFYVEKRMENLKTMVARQKKEIGLLKIEWTYLNQNARLQAMARKYLPSWQPIEAKQLKSLPELDKRFVDEVMKQESIAEIENSKDN